ncbi:MAG: hypothetical protein H7301_01375 [Cryobacterium sp.]|nr:hypothetical protein [Oligoflexia bacterium]
MRVITRGLTVLSVVFGSYAVNANAGSTSQLLLTATSDAIKGECKISLVVNADGKATDFEYVTPSDHGKFPISSLKAGIILLKEAGQNVMILRSNKFDAGSGGELTMDYLASGVSGKRGSVLLGLERSGQKWEALANDSAGRRVVTKAFLKAKKLFGKIIGIASITLQ